MLRTGVTLDRDQIMLATAREHAIAKEGRKFITLRLVDFTKNRIQGAIVLHSQAYRDANGMNKFHFEERGGPINFELDELQGAMFARVLDVDHNRRFLASMSSYGFWEIEDKNVEAEIMEIAQGMTKKAIVKKVQPKEAKLSDEQIELEMARLQQEKSKRQLDKAKAEEPAFASVETKEPEAPEVQEPLAEVTEVPAKDTETEINEEPGPQRRGRAAKRRKSLVSVE